MQYVVEFDAAAIALCLLVFIMYFVRRSYPSKAGRVFLMLLIAASVGAVTDFISAYTISYADKVPLVLNYLVNVVYLTAYNLSNVFFYFYVLEVTFGKNTARWQKLVGLGAGILTVAAIVTSPFTRLTFYFTEDFVYEHGPAFYLLYVIAFGLLVLNIVHFSIGRHQLSLAQIYGIIGNIAMMIGVVVIQFFYTELLISSFASALMLVVIYISLERPADFLYRNTACFNDVAFFRALENRFRKGGAFHVALVTPELGDYLRGNVTKEVWDELIRRLIALFHENAGKKNVFYLHEGNFAVLGEGDPAATIAPLLETIRDNPQIEELGVSSSARFLVLACPDPFATPDMVRSVTEYSLKNVTQFGEQKIVWVMPEDVEHLDREARVLRSIRAALDHHRFTVYYQPIYNDETGKFETAEALIRLFDPELGFVPPDEFIPIAEHAGLIGAIGDTVLDEVCSFYAGENLASLGVRFIEVNLSVMQCIRKDLPDKVRSILASHGVAPAAINLEITETAAAANESVMRQNMANLTQAGIAFSLDDYGTGFCNASYLSDLPVAIVKIDKSILWRAMENERSFAVLKNTVSLVRELGLSCVAEGVENEEMASALRNLGCTYHQGFLYARPMPKEDYLAFLREKS